MKRYRIYEAMVKASKKTGRIRHKDWEDWERADRAVIMLVKGVNSTNEKEWNKAWQAEEWEVEGES